MGLCVIALSVVNVCACVCLHVHFCGFVCNSFECG